MAATPLAAQRFVNWAGNQACAPYAQERPSSEAELVQIAKTAAADDRRVKVVGAGHSFTGIACTDGHLVDLSNYGRVLSHNPSNNTITVEAGISLSTLCHELDARGLARRGDLHRRQFARFFGMGDRDKGKWNGEQRGAAERHG